MDNMIRKLFGTTVVIILTGFLAGCATTASNQYVGSSAPAYGSAPRQNNWIVGDRAFARKITFKKARQRDADGFLNVQVSLTNLSSKTIYYETKFEWFDTQGFKIDNAVEMWKPGLVYGKSSANISTLAPSTAAVSYRFFIRKSNPIVP